MADEANPFTPVLQQLASEGIAIASDTPRGCYAASVYAAETLWSLFGELPDKAAARLAQRRLQEAVFWAEQAAVRVWS